MQNSSEILIRYLGGDKTLINEINEINEIKAIDDMHRENPDNIAQVFRNDETVQENLIRFTQDQMNYSTSINSLHYSLDFFIPVGLSKRFIVNHFFAKQLPFL
jgi:hypothetical protein